MVMDMNEKDSKTPTTPTSLAFRPVATQITHDPNPVLISLYEARAPDGRIIQIQLTSGLTSVTWDGAVNEDGSPKVSINANVNATSSWKPGEVKSAAHTQQPALTPPATN